MEGWIRPMGLAFAPCALHFQCDDQWYGGSWACHVNTLWEFQPIPGVWEGLLEEEILKQKVKTKTECSIMLRKNSIVGMTEINTYRECVFLYQCPSYNSEEIRLLERGLLLVKKYCTNCAGTWASHTAW